MFAGSRVRLGGRTWGGELEGGKGRSWQAEARNSQPLRETPQTYFSLWCLGSRRFMGLPSPTMILVALNCVSPLIDAEAVLQPGGRPQPGPHLDSGPARMPCLTPGSQGHQEREGVVGVGPLHLKQEPGERGPPSVSGGTKRRRGLSKITHGWERTCGLEIAHQNKGDFAVPSRYLQFTETCQPAVAELVALDLQVPSRKRSL